MADKFFSIEEAAARLGIDTAKLVEMRASGQVRGFKDGKSWKFPTQEIERLADEGLASSSDDVYSGFGQQDQDIEEGSAELVLEQGAGSGSRIIGGDTADKDDSDLEIGSEALSEGSDVALVASPSPAPGSGSDVMVVASSADSADDLDLSLDLSDAGDSPADGDDLDLGLSDDALGLAGESDLDLGLADEEVDAVEATQLASSEQLLQSSGSGVDPISGVDLELGSDPDLDLADKPAPAQSEGDLLSELDMLGTEEGSDDLIVGDSEPLALGGDAVSPLSGVSDIDDALGSDDDMLIANNDDDDLVLGSAEDLLADSGFNVMSPSDSGLSLESAPLNLSGSNVSAFDLMGDEGQSPGSGGSGSGIDGSGSLVDFQADEEFQLSPSGMGLEADDDSGSQVIDVEDSEAFGGALGVEDAGGWADQDEAISDDAGIVADPMDDDVAVAKTPMPAPAPTGPAYEVPNSLWNVITLAGLLIMLSIGGMLMTDLARNLWGFSEPTGPLTSLTETILNAFGLNG